MTLKNFLQLIDNINQDFYLYIRIDGKNLPLSKITVSSGEALAQTGKKPMKKHKIFKLFKKMHDHGTPLYIFYENNKFPVYGIQTSIENSSIILM